MKSSFDRRQFLASTATIGTALAAGLSPTAVIAADYPHTAKPEAPMAPLSLDSLYSSSLSATSLTGEAADRIAIQDLINGWAHCADRRLPEKQAALFTDDGVVSIYMGDPATNQPVSTLKGAAELIPALGDLRKFVQTTHLNGQSTVVVQGDRAVGESYCLAHQISETDGKRTLQILSIRYHDDFVRQGDRWLFAQRKLIIDWSETRPLAA